MIKLRNINKVYTKNGSMEVKALNDVSLDIKQGEFVSIIGPSGSGKTTLMNLIGLLDNPSSGTYRLDNQEVDELDVDELAELRNKKIGFIFQSFHLLSRTSAIENVELPLVYSDRKDFTALAHTALQTVGLDDRMDHYPSELSGGQQQRVAIARALVNEPDILLADEPTGNLDSRAGLEVMRIFQDLHRQGKTIILITHDRSLAEHSGRVIQIEDGRNTGDTEVKNPRQAAVELSRLSMESNEAAQSQTMASPEGDRK